MKKFDTTYLNIDNERRERHGEIWKTSERAALSELLSAGATLQDMCVQLKRPAAGVVSKLCGMSLLVYDSDTGLYFHNKANEVPFKPKPPTKENTMQANIEVKTFICGTDAKPMSDADIFAHIARIEREIKDLSAIQSRPKKLDAMVAAKQADIAALVAYVDGRA